MKEQDSHQKYRFIVDSSAELITMINKDYVYEVVNKSYCAYLNKTKEEILGNNVSSVWGPYVFEKYIKEELDKCLFEAEHVHYEKWIEIRPGIMKFMDVDYYPFSESGTSEITHAIVYNRDRTDRQLAIEEKTTLQEQLNHSQKMEALGHLAGGLAHDINNILTAIYGYADLLDEEIEDEEIKQDINSIRETAERAKNIIQKLLLFSRKKEIELTSLDLNGMLRNLDSMLKRLLFENIDINLHLGEDIPFITGDISSLEQVMINLALNSADAMPDGGQINIKTEKIHLSEDTIVSPDPEFAEGYYIRLSFEDTGSGFPEEMKHKIFEPFFTTKKKKGTGLGLSIIYGILKQHNAHVNVYSEEGKGTRFHLYFPCKECSGVSMHDAEEDKEQFIADVRDKKILYIEDDPTLANTIKKVLEKYGFTVILAEGVVRTREIIKHYSDIDICLVDVFLRDGNGLELADELLKNDTVKKIIITSGYIDNRFPMKEIEEKGLVFLEKPFSARDIIKILDN